MNELVQKAIEGKLSDAQDKIDEGKMQEKGVFFNALSRMDTILMNPAFRDFCRWANNINE